MPPMFCRLHLLSLQRPARHCLQTLAWRGDNGSVNGHQDMGDSQQYPEEFSKTVAHLHTTYLADLMSNHWTQFVFNDSQYLAVALQSCWEFPTPRCLLDAHQAQVWQKNALYLSVQYLSSGMQQRSAVIHCLSVCNIFWNFQIHVYLYLRSHCCSTTDIYLFSIA